MKMKARFSHDDVTVHKIDTVYQGFFKVQKYEFDHALFAGGRSERVAREILERGDAVAVLPYDPNTDEVLLIEQIRIGAHGNSKSPWLLETIAGMCDGSTDFEDVAKREAMEEAGIKLDKLHRMLSYYSSPGGTTERLHLFAAMADLSNAGGVHGLASEHEDIRVHVLPLSDALMRLNSGEIDNAATVICLQWLALNKATWLSNES